MLEALLNESSQRRVLLEQQQAARAAQLMVRQQLMAAAAQARRQERLQLIGHLAPAPKPVTSKEELDQLRKWVLLPVAIFFAEGPPYCSGLVSKPDSKLLSNLSDCSCFRKSVVMTC